MSDKNIKRKISIFINDKEVIDSLGAVGREIGKLKRLRKEADNPQDRKKYNEQLQVARKRYAELNEEIEETNTSLQDAKSHFSNIFDGFLSGDSEKVISGLNGIKSGFKGILASARAFIATPVGLVMTALAGIAFVAKNWVDFNIEIEKTNELIRDITNTTGEATNAIRIRAEALQEVFGTEVQESVKTAKSLVESFSISYDEAFKLIEESAVKGKLKNDDFLDSLKEYPVQFKNAGYSAKEFVDIVNAGYDLSIYTDKLPDALKEADLALKEQTKATREALVNAFGASFSDDLLKRVRTGKITTKQALQEISKQAEKANLNQQQQAQLTADLFKGAGEDAGGALKVLKAVNTALNEQKKPLTETQKLRKEELETKKELNAVTTQLFASSSEGFGRLIQKGKIFATKTLLNILKAGVDIYNWFVDLNNKSRVFSAILTTIGKSATSGFKTLGILISNAWKSLKGLAKFIVGVFTHDLKAIRAGFKQNISIIPNVISEIKDKAVKDANDIYDAFQGKNKMKRITLKAFTSNEESTSTTTTNTTRDNLITGSANTSDVKAKEKAFAKAEEEINKLIEDKRKQRELSLKKGLDREIAEIEASYTKLEEKYSNHKEKLKELEALKQQEIDEAKLAKQQEFLEQANELEDENRIARKEAELEREIEQAETDEEKATLLLEKTQTLANLELEIEKEKELAKVEAVEGAEKLKAQIREKYALKKKKLDDTFQKEKAKADNQAKKNEDSLNKQRLNAYADMFGGIAELLGKHTAAGKAAAIAQATINTFQGVTEVWAAKSVLPEPAASIAKGVATAGVIASGLAAVSKITSTQTPTFYYGGHTGSNAIGYDGYGKITGLVHDNEWVAPKIMTQNPKYAQTFSYLEAERQRLTKGYFYGGPTSNNTQLPQYNEENETSTNTDILNPTIISLLTRIADATEKGNILVFGYDEALKIRDLLNDLDSSKNNGNFK